MRTRAAWLDAQYIERARRWGHVVDRSITPRFLVAHGFAHALINQLSLEAGYPAAALRERLYVFGDAAGVLVYTATTDSAGSLGGVIAQADPTASPLRSRRQSVATHGARRTRSASRAPAVGADALNLAACHACALLPETSCEEMNALLDRALLVGTPDDPDVGYFEGILDG